MSHRFVRELCDQESVNQIFLASGKQLRPNRNGNLYLQVDLSDSTGSISARMWNATDEIYRTFEDGDFVLVEGTTQIYQGGLQLIAKRVSKANAEDVNQEHFLRLTQRDVDRLVLRLGEILRAISDPHLKALGECFLIDEELMARLSRAPAGVKNHHAYWGGLLEHIVSLMEAVLKICECYTLLDRDALIMGAFLHDLGKIDELSYEHSFGYTDGGQLLGHVVQGVTLLDGKLNEVEQLLGESISPDKVIELKHMIVSHHGEYDFGSPKLPMTLEAITLHLLDNLDAKLHAFGQLMQNDANVDSRWTSYHANIARKLYKSANLVGNGARAEMDSDENRESGA